jgi:hypothetical protein
MYTPVHALIAFFGFWGLFWEILDELKRKKIIRLICLICGQKEKFLQFVYFADKNYKIFAYVKYLLYLCSRKTSVY